MITPVERHGGRLVKRDDLYTFAGMFGGKVRTCQALAEGAVGLITAGSRHSPQVEIVAGIAKHMGIPCRVHVPTGEDTPALRWAAACGAEVIRHKPGHNSVIVARARQDAEARPTWTHIPFGMRSAQAVAGTASQVVNIPAGHRVVIPVGSAMSLCGLLQGLAKKGLPNQVLGVVVGSRPERTLDQFAPYGWRFMVQLVDAQVPYSTHVEASLGRLHLDPVYEAKCTAFLKPDDLLWVVGHRKGDV